MIRHTLEERSIRRARVAAAKDALQRSAQLDGVDVARARAALKQYLRQLDERNQPSDAAFEALLQRPFDDDRRSRVPRDR
jgi:hypothetical protein